MAKQKKETTILEEATNVDISDSVAKTLIADINREFGMRVAYNLSDTTAPTMVKSWISTNSLLLDYAIANRRNGGYPSGRIIEISGLPSTGKSHLAYEAAKVVQHQGGLVVYIDTENATSVEKLADMGIDVTKKFVYIDTHCTEEVFSIMDSIITKSKSISDKGLPILVIWDSVAGTSPKAELEGDYDANTMGLQARVLSKGFRKITGLIGQAGVTLLCINQLRSKLTTNQYSDPYTSPGGNALPFHASIRIRLTGEGSGIKDTKGNIIGIRVPLKIVKNKVAPPFRNFPIEIHFGKGIVEDETLVETALEYCVEHKHVERDGRRYSMIGKGGAWKTFIVTTTDGEVLFEKKFTKNTFSELMQDAAIKTLLLEFFDSVLTVVFGEVDTSNEVNLNPTTDE
jgi:recombination protein RecA